MPSNKAKLKLQEVMSGIRHSEVCLKPKKRPEQIEEDSYDPEDLINECKSQYNKKPFVSKLLVNNCFRFLKFQYSIKLMNEQIGWLKWKN